MFYRLAKPVLFVVLAAAAAVGAQAEGLNVGGMSGNPDITSSFDGSTGAGTSTGSGLKVGLGDLLTPHPATWGAPLGLGPFDASGRVNTGGLIPDGLDGHGFAPRWSLLAQAGAAPGHLMTIDGDGSSPARKVGAGLQYSVSEIVALRAEYDHTHYTDGLVGKPNLGEFSVGLKVAF